MVVFTDLSITLTLLSDDICKPLFCHRSHFIIKHCFTHHSNPFICKRGSGHLSGFLLTLTTRLSHIDCPLLGLAGSPSSLHVRRACGKTLDLETSTGAIIIYLSNCNFTSYLHQGHLHRLPIRGSGRVSLVIACECVPSATQITGHYLPKAWV